MTPEDLAILTKLFPIREYASYHGNLCNVCIDGRTTTRLGQPGDIKIRCWRPLGHKGPHMIWTDIYPNGHKLTHIWDSHD